MARFTVKDAIVLAYSNPEFMRELIAIRNPSANNSISANVWKICAANTRRCVGKEHFETTSN